MKQENHLYYLLDKLDLFQKEIIVFSKHYLFVTRSVTTNWIDLQLEFIPLEQKWKGFLDEKKEYFSSTKEDEPIIQNYVEKSTFLLQKSMDEYSKVIKKNLKFEKSKIRKI